MTPKVRKRKVRFDELVVKRGFANSLGEAAAIILAGQVRDLNGTAYKPGERVFEDLELLKDPSREFVGRGANKLGPAITDWGVGVQGKTCADVGSSTGGFTQILLSHGASKVFAIDVGYGELAWELRADPRVVVMERTNARHLLSLPEPVSLVVGDVSFISWDLILPNMRNWLTPQGEALLLVKPQFELPENLIPQGGVVTNPLHHEQAIQKVKRAAISAGFEILNVAPSQLPGRQGNLEFFLHLKLKD